MLWFDNPQTVEELKKQYKKLAFEHHPDRGGNTEHMKEINTEYGILFERLKNIHATPDGKTYRAKTWTDEKPEEFREIINRLISLEGIQCEVCGSWLWVSGNTYPHRETLKRSWTTLGLISNTRKAKQTTTLQLHFTRQIMSCYGITQI